MRAGDDLRRKIGQMIVVGFVGSTLDSPASTHCETLKVDLAIRNLGGVVVSGANKNLYDPDQILRLLGQINHYASTPPIIAVDQEGGRVARLNSSNGFAASLSHQSLGRSDSESVTRSTAGMMAGWLASMGMNVNFAPVVDVNVNPLNPIIGGLQRSFSPYPMTVAKHAAWYIEEFHARNIATTLKHFPGHGSSVGDSHNGFTDVTFTWADSELVPYRELFAKGIVDMVMTAHIFNATIDTLYPATLSAATLDSLLRRELGYNGLLITDSMTMGAITNEYGFDEAVITAVNAGADILLYNNNLMVANNNVSLVERVIDLIERSVMEGTISMARIDEANERIAALKAKYVTSVQAPYAQLGALPGSYELVNYPNPFNPSTVLRLAMPQTGRAALKIYDLLGREVSTLFEGTLTQGAHIFNWNAESLPAGIYFARLSTQNSSAVRKMVLLK